MTTSPKAVRFDDDTMWVSLSDGLHWDALDEDISVAGLLAGQADLSNRLIPPPQVLQKALKQSADQARRLANAFGATVPSLKVKTSKH